jgi:UDP-N-acetyl-2-amino-2-deoxyglucuronate dehydrogenase
MLLSIFADELGVDITKAVPTIKSWGLDTVDLRGRIYGKSFESLDAQQLVDLKKLLDDNGMKVACLQSSLAKSHQPDAEVRKAEAEKLEGIIRAADALECRRVRSFYFWQRYEGRQGALAAQPDQLQKTMDMFAPLADRAKEAGLTLAFENCGTTPDEVLAMLDLMDVPEWGLAWDPHNNWGSEEWKSGGDAYVQRMISHSTMLHIKARYAVEGLSEDLIPYDRILELFLNRGLDGPVSVETHNPDKQVTNDEMSKRTVLAMQRAWPTAAQGGVVARKSGHGLKRPWHDDPVGFAVVGLGMGFNRARQLTETSGTRLIGVCDLDAERAQKAGGTLDVPHTLEMDRWLDDDNVEVIMVMTETGNHGKVAERALNAGKHVISTKPMDANVANCDRMIALAEEKGLTLGVDLEMRHTPGFCALERALEGGQLGKLRGGNLHLKVQRTEEYFKNNNAWRGTRALDGGGVLSNQSIHYIDQVAFTAGVPARVRCSVFNQCHPYIEAEDLGSAVWEYADGHVITYNATTSFPQATWYYQYELHGEDGAFFEAAGGPFDMPTTKWYYDGAWRTDAPVDGEPEWFNSMDNFAAHIREGIPLTATGRDGRVSRVILDAMYESAYEHEGGWAEVNVSKAMSKIEC